MNRLETILQADTTYVSEQLLMLLEKEIYSTLKNYLLISSPVKVRFTRQGRGLHFNVDFAADRVKAVGYGMNKNF